MPCSAPKGRSASNAPMPSLAIRTSGNLSRSGASSKALVQSLGSPRAGPARPPQMLGAAISIRPSRSTNGPQDETPTTSMSRSLIPASSQAAASIRRICSATASGAPVVTVGSERRASKGAGCVPAASVARLTAILLPPTSTQAFMVHLLSCVSDQPGNQAGHKAQQDRGGHGNKPVSAKQAKAQVAGQFAKAEFLQQRAEPADEHQREKNDDEPADHGVREPEIADIPVSSSRASCFGRLKLQTDLEPPAVIASSLFRATETAHGP